MITMEEAADFLVERRIKSLPIKRVAEFLDSWSWLIDDNGLEIQEVIERWLQGDDEMRVELALSVETVPFKTKAERELVLRRLAERWPRFSGRCERLINYRGFS